MRAKSSRCVLVECCGGDVEKDLTEVVDDMPQELC